MRSALVLAAHGSSDPRYGDVVQSLVSQLRLRRPWLAVEAGYLEHGPPQLRAVARGGSIVVPLLLSSGYHAGVDVPEQAPGCRITPALGPDPRLIEVLARRLRAAGWVEPHPVVLAGAGSANSHGLADVRCAASSLSARLGVEVRPAFVSAGEPRLRDVSPKPVVATYLLAPGRFADAIAGCGATVVSAPIGAAPEVVDIVLDRYDTAVAADRRSPVAA